MRRSAIGLEGWKTKISIRLSHDDRVGVKWKWTFGCFLSQRWHFLWVLRLSRTTCNSRSGKAATTRLVEQEELDTAPPLGMLGNNPAAGDFERCKQGRGAIPQACNRSYRRSRRVRSGASSSLAPAPTPGSKASHRHRERSPWQAGRYKVGARRPLSPRTQGHCSRTRTCGRPDGCCARAESTNVLNVDILQRHRQQRTRPAGVARRRRLIQKRQNASVRRLTVDWLLACPRGDHSVQRAHDRQSDAAIC